MYITFLRNSLITSSRLCPGKSWIEYGLGRRSGDNHASAKGTILHSVLENLAKEKLSRQNGCVAVDVNPYDLLDEIYNQFEKDKPNVLKDDSHKDCVKLLDKVLAFRSGVFNPLNQNIVAMERYFDIEITKPWAAYEYETPNGPLIGNLKIKGNADLICEEDGCLSVTDYKTGRLTTDWATDKEKTAENIREDTQLKLYFWALAHEFPEYENIMLTIYFIRYDRPLTAIYDRSELPEIEEWIRKGYKKLKEMDQPKFIDRGPKKWKCKMCEFSKTLEGNSGKTVCKFFQDELKKKGFQKANAEHTDFSTLTSYGAGGGCDFRQ